MEDLVKLKKTGIVELVQHSRVSLEPKLTLAGFNDRALEAAAQFTEIARTPCVLNGAHVAPDLLSIAAAHRIDSTNLSVDNREGRPFPG